MIIDGLNHILKLYLGGSGPAVVYNRFIWTIPAVHWIEKKKIIMTATDFRFQCIIIINAYYNEAERDLH